MNMNPYHNAPPQRLLDLKLQESNALLELLRSMTGHHTPEHMARVAGFTLKGQLGIKKICLLLNHKGVLQSITCEGFQGRFWKEGELSNLNTHLPVPVQQDRHPSLYKAGVEYIILVSGKSNIEGFMLVGAFAQSEAELQNDLIFMQTVAGILGIALENHRLFDDTVAREAMKRELALAESIQQRLLPSSFDHLPGIRAKAKNIPHQQVGGDFYELIPAGKNIYYLCMADVAGKSISAALLMAVMQAGLKVLTRYAQSPEEIVRQLHTELITLNQGEKFVTLFLGKINLNDFTLTYINAGHNPPLIRSPKGIQELKDGCIPLGIMQIDEIETGIIPLNIGDIIFLYTDGLTEQENSEGEMLGAQYLASWLSNYSGIDPVEDMLKIWEEFAQNTPPSDDISLMSVYIEDPKTFIMPPIDTDEIDS